MFSSTRYLHALGGSDDPTRVRRTDRPGRHDILHLLHRPHPWDQTVRTAGESNADGGDDVIQCRRYSVPLLDVTNGFRTQYFYALAKACQRDSVLTVDHVAEGDRGGGPCPIAQQNLPAHSAPGGLRRASGVRTMGRHRGKHPLQFPSADTALLPWRRVG